MTTEELESRLEAGTETQGLDFKADCPWDVKSLAKDILAMSNHKDGGYIIIGIEDGTMKRQGVSAENLATFNIDVMRDQMTRYADPSVDMFRFASKDKDGREYVVIQILPFKDVPVICRHPDETAGLRAGVIYYRNSNRRIESAAVSNSSDMRDIIETATLKRMQRMKEFGFVAKSVDDEKLKEELKGL